MSDDERPVSGGELPWDDGEALEDYREPESLRPATLPEFIGQERVKASLSKWIAAARERKEPLEHVLLSGPPGLGKTTLAHIIAREMDGACHTASGPALRVAKDLVGPLTNLERGDVLFIDEIHRLPTQVEEYLYSAMEDFVIDIMIDSGPSARSLRMDLQPFTLVGATTLEGLLSQPMLDRFGIPEKLELYDSEALATIATRSAGLLEMEIDPAAALLIATRSRGTPRLVNRITRRVRDVTQVAGRRRIEVEDTHETLEMLQIDAHGLHATDRKLLEALAVQGGRPIGLKTLATIVGESEQTIEGVYEPYLIQQGYLVRTPRGRELGYRASELGLGGPATRAQGSLFD